MLRLSEYRQHPDRVADLLPWAGLLQPGVLLTKSGELVAVVQFRGHDLESADPAEQLVLSARINNIVRRLTSGWALQTEACRLPIMEYPTSSFVHAVPRLLDAERAAGFLEAGRHFETTYYLTFTYRTPTERRTWLAQILWESLPEEELSAGDTLRYFGQEIETFVRLLGDVFPSVERLTHDRLLTYLHFTATLHTTPTVCPEVPIYLDVLLGTEDIVAGIRPRLNGQYLRLLTVRSLPPATTPNLFAALESLAFPYRWVQRWMVLDRAAALKLCHTYERRWLSKRKNLLTLFREQMLQTESKLSDPDAEDKAADARAANGLIAGGHVALGYYTGSLLVWDEDAALANSRLQDVMRVFQGVGATVHVEDLNAVEAWLGMIPGHVYANVRRPLLHSMNLSHLLPCHAMWAGPARNAHLDGPPLLYASSTERTPFRLSLHQGDVADTLIIGPKGCHAKGTRILMADGTTKAVEYLDVGEAVMGPDSQPRTILRLHRGHDIMMRITPSRGAPFVVNMDHILALRALEDSSYPPVPSLTISVASWLAQPAYARCRFDLYHVVPRCVPFHQFATDTWLAGGFMVEEIGPGEYYGFECDGDHLYLTGDFMVHHNSGKSTLLSLLALQWQRYPEAQVFFFDQGRSAEVATRLMGGRWYALGSDEGLALQPLAQIDQPEEQTWAMEWLEILLTQEHVEMTPERKQHLWQAVVNLGQAASHHRTMSSLTALLQDVVLRDALQAYTLSGVHGALFDAETDALSEGAWQCFEMGALLERPSVVVPTLFALFHRLEQWLTGAPTIIVLDEAWIYLDHPAFAQRIRLWLKTLRKLNASVIFASQNLADVAESSIASTLIQECQTRIFLPNARAIEPEGSRYYQAFGLSPRQIEVIAMGTPKRHYYYQSSGGNRLFELELGPIALACAGAGSPDDLALMDHLYAEDPEGLVARWFEAQGLAWVSGLLAEEAKAAEMAAAAPISTWRSSDMLKALEIVGPKRPAAVPPASVLQRYDPSLPVSPERPSTRETLPRPVDPHRWRPGRQ